MEVKPPSVGHADRIVDARVLVGPQPSKAWATEHPGLPASECPPNQRDIVVFLALVVVFPLRTEPNEAKWPRHVKPLRELFRAPEHEVFGDLPNAPPRLVLAQ
jgi:hypothetical protein